MKKFLLLTFIVACAAVSALQAQNCPQIVLQSKDIKPTSKTGCEIIIADPGHTQYNYNFYWKDSVGGWHQVACLSGFHYMPKYNPDHSVDESKSYTTIGITSDVIQGHPLYGIKDGTEFYIQKHCVPFSNYADCFSDTNLSPTSAHYQIKFKGH